MGIAFNLSAGAMHLLRSAGIYFGDARPVMSGDFERKAGVGHVVALLVLFATVKTLPNFALERAQRRPLDSVRYATRAIEESRTGHQVRLLRSCRDSLSVEEETR